MVLWRVRVIGGRCSITVESLSPTALRGGKLFSSEKKKWGGMAGPDRSCGRSGTTEPEVRASAQRPKGGGSALSQNTVTGHDGHGARQGVRGFRTLVRKLPVCSQILRVRVNQSVRGVNVFGGGRRPPPSV